MFVIASDDQVNNSLLVFADVPVTPIGDDSRPLYSDRITVNGTVRQFRLETFEQDLAIDLADEDLAIYEGSPILMVDSIEEVVYDN